MINYELPTKVIIDDKTYSIRNNGDWRVVMDIFSATNDKDLSLQEKEYTVLYLFYGKNIPADLQSAHKEISLFLGMGVEETNGVNKPKLMDWEQDFNIIISAINKVLGYDVRTKKYVHWWTFMGAFNEIDPDCLFGQIVRIRSKRYKGQKLDKYEQIFFRENRDKILFKNSLSQEDEEWLNSDD